MAQIKHYYYGFGYNIMSDIPLPELIESRDKPRHVDLAILRRDLTDQWKAQSSSQKNYITSQNEVLFQIKDTAIFLVKDGNRITVSPKLGTDINKIRLFILGTCMGILLMQRKVLPLHGSVIAIDGKAYAFIGERGAGKSTLATAFLKRGYKLLTDDVIPVSLEDGRRPYVIPSYPQQKLWEESLEGFKMEASQFNPLFERETKYAIPVQDQFITDPLPLAGIFELLKTDNKAPTLQNINGLERLSTLFYHTYRNFLLAQLNLLEWHFQTTTLVLSFVDIFRLQRPSSGFTANELVSLILNNIEAGEQSDVSKSEYLVH